MSTTSDGARGRPLRPAPAPVASAAAETTRRKSAIMTGVVWNRMTAARLRDRATEDAVVLLPIGATEQDGPHLPTGVDAFLATEVCRRAAQRASS